MSTGSMQFVVKQNVLGQLDCPACGNVVELAYVGVGNKIDRSACIQMVRTGIQHLEMSEQVVIPVF